MNFKVSDIEKNEILQEIKASRKRMLEHIRAKYEDYENSDELITDFNDKLDENISILENDNVVTRNLIMMCPGNIEITVSEEQKNEFLSEIVNEDDRNDYERLLNRDNQKIGFRYLKSVYMNSGYFKDKDIILEPDTVEKFLLFFSANSYGTKEQVSQLISKIETGKLPISYYTDFLKSYMPEETKDKQLDVINKYRNMYNDGIITEDEFLHLIGTDGANPFLDYFKSKHSHLKRGMLETALSEIQNITIPEDMSEANKEKLISLLDKMSHVNIAKQDESELLGLLDEYNDISNDEWKAYLDDTHILIHETKLPMKGQFYDYVMSTSLVSPDHKTTYQKHGVGYKIKPKHISRADSKDMYVLNARKDKYAQRSRLAIKLPQIVDKEMKEENNYSEIIVDDFEIVSVISLHSNFDREKVKALSDARGGIPIEIMFGDGIISLEDYDTRMQIINNLQNMKNIGITGLQNYSGLSNIFKIDNPSTSFTNVSTALSNINEYLEQLKSQVENGQNIDEIISVCSSLSQFNEIIDSCNKQQEQEFTNSLGKKAQVLVANMQKSDLKDDLSILKREKVGILGILSGKARLRRAMMENLKLKIDSIQPDEIEYNNIEDILNDLYEKSKPCNNTAEVESFMKLCVEHLQVDNKMEYLKKIKDIRHQESTSQVALLPDKSNLLSRRRMAKNIEEENATIQSNKTMVHKSNFADRYKVIDNPGARKIIKVERDIADIVNPKEADRSQQRDFQIR